ncbi:restriction endonuclease [Roseateles aquatilis]|uniref:Restriction endonuclease n=1 Tax=Roseateles aquatilis TaxID=431061 RepID=A0A246JMW9_9BURK|nr:restriction endonuclease [Roseateles aquatilis]OWQ93843.1 restriction endonuclease [Roseateles aquatilis]
MARRKRTSPAEDLLNVFALLPWWLCVVLAAVSYVGLHAVASRPALKPQVGVDPMSQLTSLVTGAGLQGLATVGQYALPILLLAAAVMSVVRRRARRQLVEQTARGQDAAAIDGMTWHQFELLVGEGFRQQGYIVTELGGSGPDGGVDLVLRRPGKNGSETFLVQCKQWKAYQVGVDVVRELYGVMAAKGAAGGFVVTSGTFTQEAMAFADGRNVQLVDGPKLQELLAAGKIVPRSTPRPTPPASPELTTMVVCPACSHPMVRRVAKHGPNAGQAFYGCSTYPVCKGTRPA